METYQISLLLAVVLAIAEVLTLSFILLGLSVGMLAVAMLQYLGGGLSLGRDVLVFALASLLAILLFRRIFRKRSDQQVLEQDDINRY